MNDLSVPHSRLPAISAEGIAQVRQLESALLEGPEIQIATEHLIHGGMYARTIRIPAGRVLTGALIKIATVLVVRGDVTVSTDGDSIRLTGYNVVPASAGRKQAFVTHCDTEMTMLLPTAARTVEEAEENFTDETNLLVSRKTQDRDSVVITGE